MTKYIVVRTDSDGEAKTCQLNGTDGCDRVTDSFDLATETRGYLAKLFVKCQYDIIELHNWEQLGV